MTSQDLCLEANVFVSAFSPHAQYHQEALTFLQGLRQDKNGEARMLYEPALVLYDVSQALYEQQKRGELSKLDHQDLMEHLNSLPLIFQWSPEVLELTHKLAAQYSFQNIYETAYLAIAMSRDIPLVTFDEETLSKSRKAYKKVYGYQDCYRLVG